MALTIIYRIYIQYIIYIISFDKSDILSIRIYRNVATELKSEGPRLKKATRTAVNKARRLTVKKERRLTVKKERRRPVYISKILIVRYQLINFTKFLLFI